MIYADAKKAAFKPKIDAFHGSTVGKFLKRIDKALPGKHTRKLYDNLSRIDAAILAQLRTGICRLNAYLHKITAAESNACECGLLESVPHFLFTCPRWRTERQDMRNAHGKRYWDLSFALGGYTNFQRNGEKVDGEMDRWKPNWEAVKATIAFAKATGRLRAKQ